MINIYNFMEEQLFLCVKFTGIELTLGSAYVMSSKVALDSSTLFLHIFDSIP